MKQRPAYARLALIGFALTCAASTAWAASFDCGSRWLNRTEATICDDPRLSRLDARLARRLDAFAPKTGFGQYLGLHHWSATWRRARDGCASDRVCIDAHYRALARFLDRVERCVEVRITRRSCLRQSLTGGGERETRRQR